MRRRHFLGLAAAGALIGRSFGRRARAQAETKKLTLLVGTAPPDPGCHYFYYARENGYYAQAGVEVTFLEFPAETTAVRALVAGAGEVCWAGPVSQLTAIKAGARLKALSCFAPRLDYLVVANKAIANVRAMEGHSAAVAQAGAISQIVLKLVMEKAGADISKVQWASLGNSATRLQALIAKRVDAAALNSGYAARAMHYDYLHMIGDASRDLPLFLWGFEGVATDIVAKKPEALQGFVTATMRAARWAMQNSGDAAGISEKLLPDTSKELLEATAAFYAAKKFFNENGAMPRDAWAFTNDWMVKNGDLDASYRYEDLVLDQFVDAANAELGPAL